MNIGDEIFHSWNCNYHGDHKNYLFCVMVNNCTISDSGEDEGAARKVIYKIYFKNISKKNRPFSRLVEIVWCASGAF